MSEKKCFLPLILIFLYVRHYLSIFNFQFLPSVGRKGVFLFLAEVSVVWYKSLKILQMTTDTQCRWNVGRRCFLQNVSNSPCLVAKRHFPSGRKMTFSKSIYRIRKISLSDILIHYTEFSGIIGLFAWKRRCDCNRSQVRCEEKAATLPNGSSVVQSTALPSLGMAWHLANPLKASLRP